jgi:Flp pilus assembly protein TadD
MNLKRVAANMAFAALATAVCVQTSLPQKGRSRGADLATIQRRLDRSDLAGLDAELMALAVANPADPKTLELLARLRFKQGRLAESRALYRRVLELDPRSVSAKINSARIEFVSGQGGEAVRLLAGADRGASLTPQLRLELAAAYLLVGDPTTALSVAEALPQNVKNSVGLPLFAELYLRLGRLDAVGALVPWMKNAAQQSASLAVKWAEI